MAVALLATGALSTPSPASAQDLEPQAYANVPVGLNFLLGGYGYSWGGFATDPSLPIRDADLDVHTALFAYARSLSVLAMSAKFDAILPYSWLSGEATFAGQPQSREVSGFDDPRFRFTLNFYGAPAMSMEEFASYEQDVIVGASLQVSPPLGQHDSSKLVNASGAHGSADTAQSNAAGRFLVLALDPGQALGLRRRHQQDLASLEGGRPALRALALDVAGVAVHFVEEQIPCRHGP